MKLISYLFDGHDHLSLLIDGRLYEMENLHPDIPNTMGMFLQYWDDAFSMAYGGELMVKEGRISTDNGNDPSVADLIAPIPFPASLRFAEGVENTMPAYSFGNHHSVRGEGEIICLPEFLGRLDFVPQLALVISKHARNIQAADADGHIAGFMLINKFRSTSSEHFATSAGPWLVTAEELADLEAAPKEGHTGRSWNINIRVKVNDEEIGVLNTSKLEWTFAELVQHISYGIDLYPGDIVACGPLGNLAVELKEGDVVELEAGALGTLTNTIVAEQEIG